MVKKELYFDLETTGLSSREDGIQQVACIYYEDGKEVDSIDFNINTFSYQKTIRKPSPDALKITGKTEGDIRSYLDSRKAFVMFRGWLTAKIDKFNRDDKAILIGYNSANFDIKFLRDWWLDNGDKYFGSLFFGYSIDIYYLIQEAYFSGFFIKEYGENLKNLKLETIAKMMDIKIIAHDAISDIEATIEIYQTLKRNYYNCERRLKESKKQLLNDRKKYKKANKEIEE